MSENISVCKLPFTTLTFIVNRTYSEELYGAVMHSLSTAGRRAEAQELFHEIECGLHGDKVKVGTSCFNALLLSYIQSEEWDKGLGLHEKMKSSQVAVDSSTVQGLLLAAYRSGGQEAVVSMVEEFIDSNTQMGAPSFDLVMKLLAPKEVTESNDRRQTLRSIGERYPAVKASTLNLMRAIRIAEVEDSRKPNPNSDSSDIQLRRSQAWKDATSYLLDFARVSTQFSATKKTGNKNSTSGSD
jgi:pentatricopeptide repeat protein